MAAAETGIHCCSLPRCLLPSQRKQSKPPNLIHGFEGRSSSFPLRSRRASAGFSRDPNQPPEEKGTNSPNEALLSQGDLNYLWKLAAGSIGGASVIKYGSILFPEITKPNISQALLMISVPVLVAVLFLIKASATESQSKGG